MMMGLFINKESLDNNMNLLRETLKQKIEVINYLQEQLTEYSNLDSTSQVNILHMQQELSKNTYCSYEQSSKIYYEKLQSGEINRASYFVNNNPDVLEQLEEAYKKYYRENIGTPPQDLVPPAIVSPDGAIVANDQFQNEKKICEEEYNKHRAEFETLDLNKKAEYLSNERKNFYLSLKANSNNYIES